MVIDDANVLLEAVNRALEHGADTVSYDRDFARFPGVEHRLPQ